MKYRILKDFLLNTEESRQFIIDFDNSFTGKVSIRLTKDVWSDGSAVLHVIVKGVERK